PRCPALPSSALRLARLRVHASALTQLYSLSLHDALPICGGAVLTELESIIPASADEADTAVFRSVDAALHFAYGNRNRGEPDSRSEEHTSELQSCENLECRLLLEKKNTLEACLQHQKCKL